MLNILSSSSVILYHLKMLFNRLGKPNPLHLLSYRGSVQRKVILIYLRHAMTPMHNFLSV